MAKKRKDKGTFGRARLLGAAQYVSPASRRRVFAWSVAAVGLVLAIWLTDLVLNRGLRFSNGPLSANHASFERECTKCHGESGDLPSENCSACHEKYGDRLGVYSAAAHFVYRSNDLSRREEQSARHAAVPCSSCHLEHRGRGAEITRVTDSRCQSCHPFVFDRDHPQFEFVRERASDPAGLVFTHVRHTGKVMKQQKLDDHEQGCLYCHRAEADGKGFEAIEFDRQCDSCHLTTAVETPRLPLAGPGRPGVMTFEQIRERGGLGTRWADAANPGELLAPVGGQVRKRPVYHEDPWILENLRALRRSVHPGSDLADLLTASADVPPEDARILYEEALDTLAEYADELRSRPERAVQNDLLRLGRLIGKLRRELEDPATELDASQFRLASRSKTSPPNLGEIDRLARELTQPCRECHTVADQTITRVQKSQRVLRRAEFDHRAHILLTRCLDCHEANRDAYAGPLAEVDPGLDRAEVQNLPPIETCQRCHSKEAGANKCVTCHYFHPNKGRRSELLLYLD